MGGAVEQRILVTGALGQIGTELVGALRDRFGATNVIASDIREIGDHPLSSTGPYITVDVLDLAGLSHIIKDHEITTIYHLAAILSAAGEEQPELCERVNIGGLNNVLELAKKHSLSVFAPSSIAVFGPDCPSDAPQVTPLNPTTVYGRTKVAGEVMAMYYWRVHGVDVRGLRYPGLISWTAPAGGGTTDYAVEIFHHAVNGGKYTCFVRRDTTLPMMYMDDAIRATLELMAAPDDHLGGGRAGYNIAGCSFTAGELAAEIQRRIPDFRCDFVPDIRQSYADSWPDSVEDDAAAGEWGWKAEYDLGRMVDEILDNLLSVGQP